MIALTFAFPKYSSLFFKNILLLSIHRINVLSKNKYIEKKNNKVTRGESWNAEAMYNVGSASGSKARPRYRCGKAPDQLADMEQAIRSRYDKNGNSSLRICSDPRVYACSFSTFFRELIALNYCIEVKCVVNLLKVIHIATVRFHFIVCQPTN